MGQRQGIILGLPQTFSGSGERSCGHCGAPKKWANTRGGFCFPACSKPHHLTWNDFSKFQLKEKRKKKNVEVRLVYTSIKEISFCDRFRVFPQKFLLNHTKTCGRTTARPLEYFIMLEGNKKSFKNNKSTLLEFPEWIGGDLKAHPVPGQGHLPLSQAVQSSIQRKDAPALLIFWQYFGSI